MNTGNKFIDMDKFKYTFGIRKDDRKSDIAYNIALEKVQRIKAFYNHLLAYVLFNTIIILTNHHAKIGSAEFWSFQTFSVAFFWGIGLVAHALVVFGRNIIFGQNWEEQKIKELMEREKNRKFTV